MTELQQALQQLAKLAEEEGMPCVLIGVDRPVSAFDKGATAAKQNPCLPTTFGAEWVTISGGAHEHRALLRHRSSFPGQFTRQVVELAAKTCDANCEGGEARVVQVYHDDKSGIFWVRVATTNDDDERLGQIITDAMHTTFECGNFFAEVEVVEAGNTGSDKYDQMAHLAQATGTVRGDY